MTVQHSRASFIDRFKDVVDELRELVLEAAEGASDARRARLNATIDDLLRQLTEVASRPDEPLDANLVTFQKRFGQSRPYHYVAYKIPDGFWYVTGQVNWFTWETLLKFIGDRDLRTLRVVRGREVALP